MRRASLFVTCLVDLLRPEIGEAAVRVLERQGVHVDFPAEQTCCGQAHYNAGYRGQAKAMAQHFCDVFAHSEAIVAPSGSCVAMVKRHYPELVGQTDIPARTWELTGYLRHVVGVEDVGAELPAEAAYHGSCHLQRELGTGEDPRAMLGHVQGLRVTEPADADQCCGFGGTFAMTQSAISTAMADAKIERIQKTGAPLLIGADAACLLHLEGRLRRQGCDTCVMHIAQVLDHGPEGGGADAHRA
ncbi:MAG TPA: (Fe-S)-binding protein [Bacillota bacterium]|nr:(Fe-S)-binding protein [Bacillota bacterium]